MGILSGTIVQSVLLMLFLFSPCISRETGLFFIAASISEEMLQYCGANVCDVTLSNTTTPKPEQELVHILVGCYIGNTIYFISTSDLI
jgi:hypothetical protein